MKIASILLSVCSLILICTTCKNTESSNLKDFDYKVVNLDTFYINNYLSAPIDYKWLDTMFIKKRSTDQLGRKITYERITSDTFYFEEKEIGIISGINLRDPEDQKWPFGWNGYHMLSFKTNSSRLPLKFNLDVGQHINKFLEFFGKPVSWNRNKVAYSFRATSISKDLILFLEDDIVIKILIEDNLLEQRDK